QRAITRQVPVVVAIALRIRHGVGVAADDQLVVDLHQYTRQHTEQFAEMRIQGGAATLEHEALLIVLDQDAQALWHHIDLEIGQRIDLAGNLAHQLAEFLQLFGGAVAQAAILLGPLLTARNLRLGRTNRDTVQLQRRSAGAVEYPRASIHQRVAFLCAIGGVGQLHARLHDPQNHEQRHHGQGEVGKCHHPGAAVRIVVALLTAALDDDLSLGAAFAPGLHAASLSSSYWLTQTSSWRKAGLTSCSIRLRPAYTASSVCLPARWATSVVRTHSCAKSSFLIRWLMALDSGSARQ